jgi:hypothetical protein
MNVDIAHRHLDLIPSDVWNHVFGYLSGRKVFCVLPQVNKQCLKLVNLYRPLFEKTDLFWKELCLQQKHTSWGGPTFDLISKGPFFSWKSLFLKTEPSLYICYRQKYENKIKELKKLIPLTKISKNSKKSKLKKFFVISKHSKEDKQQKKLLNNLHKRIFNLEFKLKKFSCPVCIDKLIVTIIGKERFNQIPLLKNIPQFARFDLRTNELIKSLALFSDLCFPPIVRGETNSNIGYIFLRTICLAKDNQIIGIFQTYILYGKSKFTFIKQLKVRDKVYPFQVEFGISVPIIKFLENTVSLNAHHWPHSMQLKINMIPNKFFL